MSQHSSRRLTTGEREDPNGGGQAGQAGQARQGEKGRGGPVAAALLPRCCRLGDELFLSLQIDNGWFGPEKSETSANVDSVPNFLHMLLNVGGPVFVRPEGDARKGGFGSTPPQPTPNRVNCTGKKSSRSDVKLMPKLKLMNGRRSICSSLMLMLMLRLDDSFDGPRLPRCTSG